MPARSDNPIDAEPTWSHGDRARLRTFHREFLPGVAVYCVAVMVTGVLIGDDPSMPRRLLLLLPLLPALWSGRAIVRSLRRADEFERVLQLESMAVGFGVVMAATMVLGSLGMHADPNRFNQVAPWIVFSIGYLAWSVTASVRVWRCR